MTTLKKFVMIALILTISLFVLSDAAPVVDSITQSANGGNGGNGGNAVGGTATANSGSAPYFGWPHYPFWYPYPYNNGGPAVAIGGPAQGGNGGNGGNGGTNVAVQDVY
ncbi:8272_t:CDS:1 [Ambispora leptoticha]|uniref:8272_t:CDS:1 n=1 Tax=Ambispora leptoticha TaxID=144679 RepID=A0A9N9DKK8_9GLOM|nr:8272_t:CDS:1 [Ambispora leptoticha]